MAQVESGVALAEVMATFPMPIEPIVCFGRMRVANGAVYRAVMALCVAYWSAGCVDLPEDDATVSALIRMPCGHWTNIKSAVMLIFNGIKPELDQAHGERVRVRQVMLDKAMVMRAKQSVKKAQLIAAPVIHARQLRASDMVANSDKPPVTSLTSRATVGAFTDK